MRDGEKKPKRHMNAGARRALLAAAMAQFAKEYGRKAQKNHEPNDRGYDREFERRMKRTNPLEIDRLLREDED